MSRFLPLVVMALFSGVAGAAPVAAPGAFNTFMATATGVGQYTVGFGSGGVPMTAPSVPTIHTAGATPIATFTGMFPAASGRIPVTVTSPIAAAEVRAVIGRFLGRAIPVVSTGIALYEVALELGVFATRDPQTGEIGFSKKETVNGNCTGGTCYKWPLQTGEYTKNLQEACDSWAAYYNAGYSWRNCVATIVPNTANVTFVSEYYTASEWRPAGPATRTGTPDPTQTSSTQTVPLTHDEFLDLVAKQSGWPSTSNISKLLADAAAAEVAQATTEKPAVKIQTGTATVTGPATGPSTTGTSTRPSPTGTGIDTEQKTCTPQYVYSLAVINTSEACVTTVTKPDGSTTTTETSTKPVVAAPAPSTPSDLLVCGLPNTPACKIDETDTPKVVTATEYDTKVDTAKTKQTELKDKAAGLDDKSFFSGWSSIFVTPPLSACTGYVLPRDMGTLDPCPVVDGVRTIMAYLWAITALVFAVRMIKEVV